MISSVSNSLSSLINEGEKMAGVADRMSRAFDEKSDISLENEVADSIVIELGHKANIRSVQAQDEMTESLLDIVA